jgi:hypothetical protein
LKRGAKAERDDAAAAAAVKTEGGAEASMDDAPAAAAEEEEEDPVPEIAGQMFLYRLWTFMLHTRQSSESVL